jgi:hypothetical protein
VKVPNCVAPQAMKEDPSTVGKLIDLLADREWTVKRAAYAALEREASPRSHETEPWH